MEVILKKLLLKAITKKTISVQYQKNGLYGVCVGGYIYVLVSKNQNFEKGTFFMSHFHDFSYFFFKNFVGQKIPHEKLAVVSGVKTHEKHFIIYKVYVQNHFVYIYTVSPWVNHL